MDMFVSFVKLGRGVAESAGADADESLLNLRRNFSILDVSIEAADERALLRTPCLDVLSSSSTSFDSVAISGTGSLMNSEFRAVANMC